MQNRFVAAVVALVTLLSSITTHATPPEPRRDVWLRNIPSTSAQTIELAQLAPLSFDDLLQPGALRRSRFRTRGFAGSGIADLTPPYSSSHALNLGGTNETVAFAHLDTDNASRVVWSFWLHNAATVADEEILNQYDTGAGTFHWSIRSIATRVIRWFLVAADCSSAVQATVDTAYSAADFVHVCLVLDGSQGTNATRMRAFLDGVESTQTFSGTAPAALCNNADTQPLYFGSFEGTSNFAAFVLDEVAIWVGGTPPDCATIYNSRVLLDASAMSPAATFCTNFNGDVLPTVVDQCGSNDGTSANMEAGDIDSADVAP